MKVLLFDMDGVLIEPHAYHRALQDTVALVGDALGYQNVALTSEEIEVIESVGVSSEWDSAAICAALLLKDLWQMYPFAFLPKDPPLPVIPKHDLPPSNFQAFYASHGMAEKPEVSGLGRAENILLCDGHGLYPSQIEGLRSILRDARSIHGSITHRLFQEYVLGSDVFESTYGLPKYLQVEGYLLLDDRPVLHPEMHAGLLDWLSEEDHRAAVFTNRPSMPPPGTFDTPEAELGLKAIDLENLPMVGRGSLAWAAEGRGLDAETFLKPSPVHVLAALSRSVDVPLEQSLINAVSLAQDHVVGEDWDVFTGAEIFVFEDSIKGLYSAQHAVSLLVEMGVNVHSQLIGVSNGHMKQRALRAAGAGQVFEDLNQALEALLGKI